MSWHFSRVAGEAFSGACSVDGRRCAPWKSTDMPGGSSWPGRMTDASGPSPSGMILAPSTGDRGLDAWISSRAASRVRISARRERERASTGRGADCGRRWPGSLARWDRDSSSWRTHQFSLLGGLEPFSGTWPRWGMMHGGECWELPTPSGLLALRASITSVSVSGSVERVPTPCAMDGKPITGGNLFVTKSGSVRHMRPDGRSSNRGLPAYCERIPTPTSSMMTLADMEQARDYFPVHKPEYIAAKRAQGHGMSNLNDTVGGALNPMWVEWLMGWPLGWTDCAASGTDKFRQWCGWHGVSFPEKRE